VQVNGGTPTTTTYNFANQITNSGYSYDNAGSLINDGSAAYTYDALSRMTARGTTTYTYNGDGTLIAQAISGVTTRYTQDLASPLTQILQTKVGAATGTDYVYGLNRLASQGGSTTTWYASDALGSVRRTFNTAATPLGVINYDPWGTPESGSVPAFGFTGELQDTTTGLVNLRARWYSTGQGRFTSVDPFGGDPARPYSLHPYAYSYSSPPNYTDPTGASPSTPNEAEGIYIPALIQMDFLSQFPPQNDSTGNPIGGEIEMPFPARFYGAGFVDMANHRFLEYYEIKHDSAKGIAEARIDLRRDQSLLNRRGMLAPGAWHAGWSYSIRDNYGLWPYGLDSSYQPQLPANSYFIIKARMLDDGMILYRAVPTGRNTNYAYNPSAVENFISTKYPNPVKKNYPGGAQPQPIPIAPFSEPNCKLWYDDGSCAEYYQPGEVQEYGWLFCWFTGLTPPELPPIGVPVRFPVPLLP
jgi:RHS repeat-associated protein